MLVSLQYEHQEEDSFLLPLETFEGFRKLIRIIVTCGKGKNISKVYELCNRAEYSKETAKAFESLVHEFETIIEDRP